MAGADLAIDPANPATLYAGTDRVVYRSVDFGDPSSPAGAEIADRSVGAPAVHSTMAGTIYAGTRSPGGVFRSTDYGLTWIVVNSGLPDSDVADLALDPGGATTVWAGLGLGGVLAIDTADGVFHLVYPPFCRYGLSGRAGPSLRPISRSPTWASRPRPAC